MPQRVQEQHISDLVADPDVLLSLPVEELGLMLLRLAKQRVHNHRHVHRQDFAAGAFPPERRDEIELAISEGWDWVHSQGLTVAEPGVNGTSGFRLISRKGIALKSDDDFKRYRAAAAFPKHLLHPAIADKVWLALSRGDLDEAVFAAFKAVEEAVRAAGRYTLTDFGVPMMRKAFDKDGGPLRDASQPDPEREALAHLFAGAIGSYKNPHSHRTVSITDPRDAQEMCMLASHLLRIVDARRP